MAQGGPSRHCTNAYTQRSVRCGEHSGMPQPLSYRLRGARRPDGFADPAKLKVGLRILPLGPHGWNWIL